jgi:hypothetical protein
MMHTVVSMHQPGKPRLALAILLLVFGATLGLAWVVADVRNRSNKIELGDLYDVPGGRFSFLAPKNWLPNDIISAEIPGVAVALFEQAEAGNPPERAILVFDGPKSFNSPSAATASIMHMAGILIGTASNSDANQLSGIQTDPASLTSATIGTMVGWSVEGHAILHGQTSRRPDLWHWRGRAGIDPLGNVAGAILLRRRPVLRPGDLDALDMICRSFQLHRPHQFSDGAEALSRTGIDVEPPAGFSIVMPDAPCDRTVMVTAGPEIGFPLEFTIYRTWMLSEGDPAEFYENMMTEWRMALSGAPAVERIKLGEAQVWRSGSIAPSRTSRSDHRWLLQAPNGGAAWIKGVGDSQHDGDLQATMEQLAAGLRLSPEKMDMKAAIERGESIMSAMTGGNLPPSWSDQRVEWAVSPWDHGIVAGARHRTRRIELNASDLVYAGTDKEIAFLGLGTRPFFRSHLSFRLDDRFDNLSEITSIDFPAVRIHLNIEQRSSERLDKIFREVSDGVDTKTADFSPPPNYCPDSLFDAAVFAVAKTEDPSQAAFFSQTGIDAEAIYLVRVTPLAYQMSDWQEGSGHCFGAKIEYALYAPDHRIWFNETGRVIRHEAESGLLDFRPIRREKIEVKYPTLLDALRTR